MTISAFDLTNHPALRASGSRRRRLAALRIMFATLRESLLAYRRYEDLKATGTPHRAALSKALDESSARLDG